ncbi:hypothetical protein ACLOJK_002123 [Asimina triloba]
MEVLKGHIRHAFHEMNNELERLELIDTLQRLGIAHFFQSEIKEELDTISSNSLGMINEDDLHATALKFRLLRQQGYMISQGGTDVFSCFREDPGNFKQSVWRDMKGMLSLYEASYLSFQGETVLDEAQAFAKKHLQDLQGEGDPKLQMLIHRALELPLHWRNPRTESRWYIETCEKTGNTDPAALELAKPEFNTVQSMMQKELQDISRWWHKLGLQKKLSFSRDRIVECFLFSLGMVGHGSHLRHARHEITKVNQLITTIDDIYDVYGSLDELELFTDAVDRWDLNTVEQLPDYMQLCFLALYNSANGAAYHAFKELGCNSPPYIKKAWADLCKGYSVEAKWYNSKYTPTVNEYLEHSWRTIGITIVVTYIYFMQGENVTKEGLDGLENYADLIRLGCLIFRLNDDLATSKDEMARGDVPKAIQCYIHEKGISESAAREEVAVVISETWKKLNEVRLNCTSFCGSYSDAVMNTTRSSHYVYQFGDGFGAPGNETEDRLMGLLVQPIPL